MAISNALSRVFNSSLNKPWKRFVILVAAGGAGLALFECFGVQILNYLDVTKVDAVKVNAAKGGDSAGAYPANTRNYLVLPILSIFVFLVLWIFRTYDTRQQIQQANFVKGLENLVSGDPLQVDVGVILLLEVSKATPAFDKEIRIAFIKRLKELPENLSKRKIIEMRSNRLSYAQYIIQWLIEHPKAGGDPYDLKGMDCRYQEFTSKRFSGGANRKLEIAKILNRSSDKSDDNLLVPGVTFEEADCENIRFKRVNLGNYNFTNAVNVDITGGHIKQLLPRGLNGCQISQIELEVETGEVLKNPDWPKPKPLANKCIQVRQKGDADSPE